MPSDGVQVNHGQTGRETESIQVNKTEDKPDQTANETITVTVGGEEVSFDQPPVIENGRTLVPIRAV